MFLATLDGRERHDISGPSAGAAAPARG